MHFWLWWITILVMIFGHSCWCLANFWIAGTTTGNPGTFRYYYWYPIDYSAAPLYCYLFQQVSAQKRNKRICPLFLYWWVCSSTYFHKVCCWRWWADGSPGGGWASPWSLFPGQRWLQRCRYKVGIHQKKTPLSSFPDMCPMHRATNWINMRKLCHRSDVCPMKINPPEIMVKRAGATARCV